MYNEQYIYAVFVSVFQLTVSLCIDIFVVGCSSNCHLHVHEKNVVCILYNEICLDQ